MNKNDIKQIIFEEIEGALKEMNMSPEMMAADSRPEDDEITPPGIEDMSPDPMFGADPSYVEEEELSEMPRTSNIFKLKDGAGLKDVLQFMQRVNDVLKTYKSPGQKRPKKRFTPEEMKALATAMVNPDGFTSKDIIANTSYNSPAQANKFLKALEMKGLITLTSQLKKSMEPTRDPNAPETRGRKSKSSEFDIADDPSSMDFGDFDNLDLGDIGALEENNTNTMSELEKYIKQVIKEAKNPLAQKMKEIENQGRVAALETKLAAIAEMIEETEGRLTRIDEDNEFKEMMDKNAVKEVRKQLKELEKAKGKLEKERAKMEGKGMKKKEVVDELEDEDIPENPNDPMDHPAISEDETVEGKKDKRDEDDDLPPPPPEAGGPGGFAVNESILRFQKLANLKG